MIDLRAVATPSIRGGRSGSATRLTVTVGITQTLAWATTYYIPAVMAGPAAAGLGVSRTLLLGGFSWALLIAGLCARRIGRRIDREGGRFVLVAGTCVTAAGLGVLAVSPNVPVWYLGWTILGFGMAMTLYDAAFATVGRLLGEAARPCIVGITLFAGFASTIAWPGGTWLATHVGWRAATGLFSLVQLGVILPILLAGIPARPPALPPAALAPPRAPGAIRAEGRAFLLLAVYFTTRAAITAAIAVHALALLGGVGLLPEQAALVAALIGPSQVASRLLDWRFARGLTPLIAAVIGAALLPVGVAILLAGLAPVLFAIAYGMSNGLLTISRGTVPMHVFGASGYATLLGRLAMPSLLAQAAAPTLLAPLIDAYPASWTLGAIGVAGGVAALCLVAVRPLPRLQVS
jgi:hypothetical protein